MLSSEESFFLLDLRCFDTGFELLFDFPVFELPLSRARVLPSLPLQPNFSAMALSISGSSSLSDESSSVSSLSRSDSLLPSFPFVPLSLSSTAAAAAAASSFAVKKLRH
ncbi:hypothetical protein Mapa_015308 [Marchantia paleacea]|nr:hypothetical protein Mapa_015308 [Marchantia paleacea]